MNNERRKKQPTSNVKYLWKILVPFSTGFLIISLLISCGQQAPPDSKEPETANEKSGEIFKEKTETAAPMIEERKDIAFSRLPAPAPPMAAPGAGPSAPKSTQLPRRQIGNILYNPPTEMTLNLVERVEARISNQELSDGGLVGTGDIIRDEIPVSEYMTVRLCCGKPEEDQPFDIVPLNSERQIVEDTGFTQWAFDVTPRKKGEQLLNLSVSAHYTYPNGEVRSKDNPVLTDHILVKVDKAKETKTWLSQQWQWLILLVLIPLLVFYVIRSLKNKNKRAALSGNESIFISYRRKDSSGYTLAIYDKLKAVLGDENVFMDMDDIPHGEDFAKHIEKVLNKANTMLVMIGEGWLNASNAHGRRLDDPNDFVRLEIATALKRDIRVIPVLLKSAQIPSKQDIPEDLQDLCMRNGIHIHDDQFDAGIQRLIEAVAK